MTKGRTRKLYRHQPLPHDQSIRLLQLLPGKEHQKVQCRLQTVSTQSCPKYEAISYVWGPRKERTHILCHGKFIKIPTNLLHCLQRLRHEKEPRILWADSICINQKDREERSKQVRIMGSIFEQAERVIVWFGRGLDFDAKAAFDLFHSLVPRCRKLDRAGSRLTPEEEIDFRSYAEGLPSSQWKVFASFLKNPWKTRGWVLQEIGLAREGLVVCGVHEMFWQDLLNVTNFIEWCCPKLVYFYQLETGSFFDIADMNFRRSNISLGSLLSSMRRFRTSDPRDKIYAILAHKSFQTEAGLAELIPINYELPYPEVYLAMARLLLRICSPVKLLGRVSHTHETIKVENKYISWVPQWNILTYSIRIYDANKYRAGKHTRAQISQRGHCLDVRGLSFDHIDWQSEVLSHNELQHAEAEGEEYQDLTDVLKKAAELERESRSFEDIFRDFCLVLNGRNNFRSGLGFRPKLSSNDRIADCLAFLKKTNANLDLASELQEKYGYGHAWRFLDTVWLCESRRFFITSKGYFGIGPYVSEPGDKVCAFFGGATPFILRPQEDGTYRLCGECYVHGLMDGEAIEMWERGELEEETFTLT